MVITGNIWGLPPDVVRPQSSPYSSFDFSQVEKPSDMSIVCRRALDELMLLNHEERAQNKWVELLPTEEVSVIRKSLIHFFFLLLNCAINILNPTNRE